jgi:hypothetical protein
LWSAAVGEVEMAESDADFDTSLERISRAVKDATGDGPFDVDLAVTAARKETDAIREETGVDFRIERTGDGYNPIAPMSFTLR